MKSSVITFVFVVVFIALNAQEIKPPLLAPIKKEDLKRDVFNLADDHFLGREAGTIDEFRGAVWLVERMKEAGMEPAGEDGTFDQFFDLYMRRIMLNTWLRIGDKKLQLWKDFIPASLSPARLNNKEIVYAGKASPEELQKLELKDKIVAIEANLEGIATNISLFNKRFYYLIEDRYSEVFKEKKVAGVIFIANDLYEDSWDVMIHQTKRGRTGIKDFRNKIIKDVPIFWLHKGELDFIKNNNLALDAEIGVQLFKYPSVNLIGKIEGTDPKLKKEYVLFSSHHDHVGVRETVKGDSIINGADDNASMCATVLAIARSFKKQPARRSALFVIHGAEELSMLGSRWHAWNPVVPKESIVCVLNGDLIGRNAIDSAALLGAWGPHRTSDDLVKAALEANEEGPNFKIDKSWDDPNHIEFFFFRSDHAPYARVGIPVLFYTSLLHDEYHTPMDNPDRINYDKLYKMTEWIYRTGWKVANVAKRPKYLEGVKFEK